MKKFLKIKHSPSSACSVAIAIDQIALMENNSQGALVTLNSGRTIQVDQQAENLLILIGKELDVGGAG